MRPGPPSSRSSSPAPTPDAPELSSAVSRSAGSKSFGRPTGSERLHWLARREQPRLTLQRAGDTVCRPMDPGLQTTSAAHVRSRAERRAAALRAESAATAALNTLGQKWVLRIV